MPTTTIPPDFQEFTHFVEHKFHNDAEPTLEASIQAFREYQRQLADLRAKVQEAREQVARGEYGPFDVEEIIREVRSELAEEGITD